MHRYQLMSQLGDGSFGIVSKAMHTQTGETVAVKKMKQRFNSWEECLALREIQSLRRLQHPNIIKLKEVVRENTELFMVFEFMEMNVYQITRVRSEQVGAVAQIFNEKEIRSIIGQTLLGLTAIHKGGFMHRDLKPENLLTKGDVVKIADFGLAKEIRSRPPFTEYVSTRWYRAPEIILRSTHYNSPIDIWACGVIFAELYINRPLFPGASDSDQLFKICSVLGAPTPQEWDEGHQLARRYNIRFPTMAPTPLRQLLSNASPAAVDLVEQMLRFNPSDRPTVHQCLQHPFFTGPVSGDGSSSSGSHHHLHHHHGVGGGSATVSSSMFQGISSGQPHNPFHTAAGLPAGGGGGGFAPHHHQQSGHHTGHLSTGAAGGGFSTGSSGGSSGGGGGGGGGVHSSRTSNSPTPGGGWAAIGAGQVQAPNPYQHQQPQHSQPPPGVGYGGYTGGSAAGHQQQHRTSGAGIGGWGGGGAPGYNFSGAGGAAVTSASSGFGNPPSPTQPYAHGHAPGGGGNAYTSGSGGYSSAGGGGGGYSHGRFAPSQPGGGGGGGGGGPAHYHARTASAGFDDQVQY